MPIFLTILIGFLNGLRSFTTPAVTAWAVYLGWLRLSSPLSYIGSIPAVIILSLLAVGEIVFDKLPNTPNRTDLPGLLARTIMGALTGACVAIGFGKSPYFGPLFGGVAAIAGCYAGFYARTRIGKSLHLPDFYVAVLEDLITIAGSVLIVSRF